MARDQHYGDPFDTIALLGPAGSGKSWLAAHLIQYWRNQSAMVPRLILDSGRSNQLSLQVLGQGTEGETIDPSPPTPATWPAITERESFENWLTEAVLSPQDAEDWLICPYTPQVPPGAMPSLMGYALPRLMRQVGGFSLLDDPPHWLLASLPAEGMLPLWVVSVQAMLTGWRPDLLPWSGHAPCLLVNSLDPGDSAPQTLATLSACIAELQQEEQRLSYVGRIPCRVDERHGRDQRWLGDLMTRLPFHRPVA